MARIIPNEKTWVAFSTSAPASLSAPTDTNLAAATELTAFVISISAQTQGNTVPTPSLDSLFETNTPGTVQASFTGDFYRDDADDLAWETLLRGTVGYFYISRFGGSGTNQRPIAGESVEVWPVAVTARTAGPMTSNTVQTFTMTAAVPTQPVEDAVVAAGSGVPTAPSIALVTATAATTALVDFNAPAYVGAGLTSPFYAVYKSATLGGSYTLCTATITGTTAAVTGLTSASTSYFKVLAHNAAGDGPQSAAFGPVTQP